MMQQDSEHLKNNNDYNADQIEVLEGIEAVRRRPGMYIGSTSSRGLHQLVFELIDNSVDEALAGYCDLVKIILNGDKIIRYLLHKRRELFI
jgi:DNA gyrase subunit B